MKRRNIVQIENYFEAFLILFFISLFIFLIHSYILPLFLAGTLVFLFHRLHIILSEKIRSEYVSAFIILFLVITMVLLPIYFVSISLVKESDDLIKSGGELFENLNLENCEYALCIKLREYEPYINLNIEKVLTKSTDYLVGSFNFIFSSISKLLVNLTIFVLAFFFLLKDGDKLVTYIRRIIPMKNDYKNALFLRFREVSLEVFVDSIFIAIFQGTLLGIGFYFFDLSSPLFWGVIASLFALIPIIGTAIVWVPAALYIIFVESNPISGIAFTIYCMLIVGLSDNVLRMIRMSKKTKIHPFLIFISILGGIEIFGFFGLFLGPIIVSMLISVLNLYNLDFN